MNDVERLIAIEDIKRVKARYFRAMDTKAWDEFRTLFTDDVFIDTSEAFTPLDHEGKPIEADLPLRAPDPAFRLRGVDGFIAAQHHHLDGVSTVHHGHTPEIDFVADDEARVTWAMEDKLRWPAGSRSGMRTMHGYGHYRERYRKVDGQWRIDELKLTRIRIDIEPA